MSSHGLAEGAENALGGHQERLGRTHHKTQIFPLVRRNRPPEHETADPEDGVQRRPQLMAEIGQRVLEMGGALS